MFYETFISKKAAFFKVFDFIFVDHFIIRKFKLFKKDLFISLEDFYESFYISLKI